MSVLRHSSGGGGAIRTEEAFSFLGAISDRSCRFSDCLSRSTNADDEDTWVVPPPSIEHRSFLLHHDISKLYRHIRKLCCFWLSGSIAKKRSSYSTDAACHRAGNW